MLVGFTGRRQHPARLRDAGLLRSFTVGVSRASKPPVPPVTMPELVQLGHCVLDWGLDLEASGGIGQIRQRLVVHVLYFGLIAAGAHQPGVDPFAAGMALSL